MASKYILNKKNVSGIIARLKKAGKKIVFTNGVFDILHRGHVEYLTKSKSFGDILVLGLNSDASVRRIKGPDRPIQPQADRAAILLGLKAVDYVIIFGEDTPDKVIRLVKPDVLVKGADWKISEIVGADFVQAYGGKVRRARLQKGRSSTNIIEKILKTCSR